MSLSPEQKLKQFKLLLAESQFDFSVAEKEIDAAFLAVISDQQPQIKTNKVPLKKKETPTIEIIKTKSGKGLWVCGQTFTYKDQLKEMGGSWNKYKQAWVFTLAQQQQLLDLFKLTEQDIGIETQ